MKGVKTMTVYMRLRADSDKNGNPRRLWQITTFNPNPSTVYVDEGYSVGHSTIARQYPGAEYLGEIDIQSREYKRLMTHLEDFSPIKAH